MKRRNLGLGVGLAILGSSMFLLTGTAAAETPPPPPSEACKVISLPGFTATGEFTTTATVADVIQVECNPEIYGTKAKLRIEAYQVWSRCGKKVWWYVPNGPIPNPPPTELFRKEEGPGVSVELDPDGNATVALLAGPNCMVGADNMITVHQEQVPFESFTTSFAIMPAVTTPKGVSVLPSHEVEDVYSSAFAAIVQVEFPGVNAEQTVRIGSDELYSRCHKEPKLRWVRITGEEEKEKSEITKVRLDNDGNGFVLVFGDSSCAAGTSLIEADLEEAPFTTLDPAFFTVESPRPT
jgi:hypothetical protein